MLWPCSCALLSTISARPGSSSEGWAAAHNVRLSEAGSASQNLGLASLPFIRYGRSVEKSEAGVLLHERSNEQFLPGHPNYGLPWGWSRSAWPLWQFGRRTECSPSGAQPKMRRGFSGSDFVKTTSLRANHPHIRVGCSTSSRVPLRQSRSPGESRWQPSRVRNSSPAGGRERCQGRRIEPGSLNPLRG